MAGDYERVNTPRFFDAPACALLEIAGVMRGDRVLDVGAGTGAVSHAALAAGADVVALDPSLPMLDAAGRRGVVRLVSGTLPDLPFRDGAFGAVLSAFVMTHVDDPEAAVREMRRVLGDDGCIALSAWSASEDDGSAAWMEVACEFAGADAIADATRRVLPGEARFAREDGLSSLLQAAGLHHVHREVRTFEYALEVGEMIASREVSASGRSLRMLLSDEEWPAYRARAREVLGRKFPGGIRYPRRVFFARGLI